MNPYILYQGGGGRVPGRWSRAPTSHGSPLPEPRLAGSSCQPQLCAALRYLLVLRSRRSNDPTVRPARPKSKRPSRPSPPCALDKRRGWLSTNSTTQSFQ
ncbi:unnamed protein product [Chondrus crispus]|uniref:Uncharacterized protein n=1 Tax=Chondrus crispus TaxID=2769 RepID=R7QSU4_CHOCR|nr:unnamed protein product [Chondrus crispus]CDF40576.1 unnamed protein product [Chondrus crispus]|eukprot:XP_005710870.1 unnamed protein product [Chondrus crispus]